ncbi:MAG TPA: CaiB/BaiF CoA-transferase family protein [Spirochaetota bacterium]|nr:CaiB/BaiF CoA-transferase family protein [Spirochaetota bacterium]
MDYPLADLKILDFTYLLPGPFGTMILADMGADIIKVENPKNPDLMRFVPPLIDGMSAAYMQVNRGKRSLGVDLSTEEGQDIVYRLVKEYDIVVEQFRPGVMERLGLGYNRLREISPSLIYCSLTGYGSTGSYALRAGHDINYLSLTGVESWSGRKDTGPSLHGIQIADLGGGSKNLVIGILAAYIRRLRTGEGERVDISITDSVFSLSVFDTAGFLADGRQPLPEGEVLNGGSLYDYYRTADGRYLSAGPIEPKFLVNFCEALGMKDILGRGILTNDQVLEAKKQIGERISSKPLEYWISCFSATDACVEPVRTLDEAVTSPPLTERDMVIHCANQYGTDLRQIGNPIKFGSGPCTAGFAGVTLGYHNDAILDSLGFDHDDMAELRKKRVFG